jgi:hypothetical protein
MAMAHALKRMHQYLTNQSVSANATAKNTAKTEAIKRKGERHNAKPRFDSDKLEIRRPGDKGRLHEYQESHGGKD